MSEYVIKVDENDERWHYVEQQYTHFFGYPITEEIVRCRDCTYFATDELGGYCTLFEFEDIKDMENRFCAWGERDNGQAE